MKVILILTVTAHSVALSWIPSVTPQVKAYWIFKSVNGGAYKKIASAPGTTFIDNGVYRGKTYTYYIESVIDSKHVSVPSIPSNPVTIP